MAVNCIIWLLVISIPAIQMVAAVSLVYKSGGWNNAVRKISYYELTANNEFTVSQDSNIIVFVLDIFSNDYLDMNYLLFGGILIILFRADNIQGRHLSLKVQKHLWLYEITRV